MGMNFPSLDRLNAKIAARMAEAKRAGEVVVVVGYTQAYAIYVHENLEAHHPVGQAKFLEQPARQVKGELASKALQQGKTMDQALLLEGLRLQRESQRLCPVDTGALRASAFTEVER